MKKNIQRSLCPMKISIIGTAGRGIDGSKMTLKLFEAVVDHARAEIEHLVTGEDVVELVSGGSAWIDHVAVRLFLESKSARGLTLFLPCGYNISSDRLQFDNSDAGRRLTQLHNQFYRKVCSEFDPFQDLQIAQSRGAVLDTSCRGFHSRNSKVAKSDIILAYTWGNEPTEGGGTSDTWKKSKSEIKLHYPLVSL